MPRLSEFQELGEFCAEIRSGEIHRFLAWLLLWVLVKAA
jgi:hypothetical protein